jgi:hypothetical protein
VSQANAGGQRSISRNAIDLQGAKVLLRFEQAESIKGKNVIIGEETPKSCEDKSWSREVVLEKAADGKNVLKITVKDSGLRGGGRGQAGNSTKDQSSVQPNTQSRPVMSTDHVNRPDRSSYGEPAKNAQAEEP